MRRHEFAALLALRYRLVWARARSRRGRIVALAIASAVVAIVAVIAGLGGLAAGAAAMQSGRDVLVARVAFNAVFLVAVAAGIFFGVEVAPAFSDRSLRRYPIGAAARRVSRHATALLEPLWIVVFTLVVGLAIGLGVSGDGVFLAGVAGAVLLVLTAYLAATIAGALLEWLLSRPGGVLIAIIAATAILAAIPMAIAAVSRSAGHPPPVVTAVLALMPPFATASATTAADVDAAVSAVAVLVMWCLGLGWTSRWTDDLPRHGVATASRSARWEHPCDRLAVPFGPLAPLAGKMLRYYVRSPQVRYNFPLALPVLAMMIAGNAPDDTAAGLFLFALGAAPATGFLATGAFATNVFGFDGQGFQRYFLLPVSATSVVVVAALVGLIPGLLITTAGALLWWSLSPPGATPAMALLLMIAAIGGLLVFHGIGLWTSIVAPRAIPFNATFGNKLSAPANMLFVAVMVAFFGLPWLAAQAGLAAVMRAWWILPCFLGVALVFYLTMLRWAGASVARRRERMLESLEGV